MRKGFWNNTVNIEYEVVIYKIGKGNIPTWWQNAFIGKFRQGIIITKFDKLNLIKSKPFLIDNEDGAGWLKIQSNGTPNLSHRSLSGYYEIQSVVNDDNINKTFNTEQYVNDNIVFEAYLRKYYPKDYEKMIEMRNILINGKAKLN